FIGVLGFGANELDLLLCDLGVGSERGELARDLLFNLVDPLVKVIDPHGLCHGGFVAEEVVNGDVAFQSIVDLAEFFGFAEHDAALGEVV
ncbi:MAG: hypothetical protein ACJA14_001725, partial [Ilumatobacter sp.]